jgi:hypothetical protein
VSTVFCTVCGAVLRQGVCPNGHPQRAAQRAQARTEQRRRWPWVLLLLFLLAAAAAYGGLRWYPKEAAGDLMGPSSKEYADALGAYRAVLESFPAADAEPKPVIEASEQVLLQAESSRAEIAAAQRALEGRSAPDIPVISERPPLDSAIFLRERMLRFYPGALAAIADLEGAAGYLTELAGTLPQLRDLRGALPGGGGQIGPTIESARPISAQLAGDVEALTPPEELGSLQASLEAFAGQIISNLDQAADTGGQAAGPVFKALMDDIRSEIRSFEEAIAHAPETALDSGLRKELRGLADRAGRIEADLIALRDQDVDGLTLPSGQPLEPAEPA